MNSKLILIEGPGLHYQIIIEFCSLLDWDTVYVIPQYKEQKYDNNRYVRDVDTANSWRLFEHIAHQKQNAFFKVALGAYD